MENVEEDRQRAEIFDALGHPTRIAILKALREGSMGFADLKKKSNIDSSGHLQHHLSKLNGLIKTDEYGKYCLSDQGKDALLTMQLVENASLRAETKKSDRHSKKKLLKPVSILLAVLLIASFTFALFEYNQVSSLQKEILQRDQTISRLQAQSVSSPLSSAEPNYLYTVPDLAGNTSATKIFLVSATGQYGYWRYNDTQVTYPLISPYAFVIHQGDPCFVINVTVRNDYTPEDADETLGYNAPINGFNGVYESFIVLKSYLYDSKGNLVNTVDFTLPKSPAGNYQFSLKSQETTSFSIYLATANRDIDHFEIKVSYLGSTPQP
jgi:DNA-binding transcriptional ArsR family regulator